jgi:transposase
MLFPQSIEEYIPPEAPVRAYDALVDSLDFAELGIELEDRKVGCPEYHPRVMLKLLVYGYSYGVRSSRKLEREAHYNLSFIWLAGGLKPDHKTIAEFRRKNKSALKKVLRQCVRLCVELGLIEGNTLFVDGTKIRGNASISNTWTKEECEKYLERTDKRIREILAECDAVDDQEKDVPSLVEMQEELRNTETLKAKVKDILSKIKTEGRKSVNSTDPDCTNYRSKQGSHAGYNVQSVVDDKHGLIVSSDVVNENNDRHQLADQIEKANETLGENCQAACADCGYSTIEQAERLDQQDIKVVMPSQRQIEKRSWGPFARSKFHYDRENDCFICPEGHVLRYCYTQKTKKAKKYRLGGSTCRECRHFGECTTYPRGKTVTRLLKEDFLQAMEQQYQQPESQEIYRRRKQKAELPFGHLKHNLKVDAFLLRGLEGVRAEASLLSTCFNMVRMISIMGVSGLVARLGG